MNELKCKGLKHHVVVSVRLSSYSQISKEKIVAAFRGMHVSPAKHSYASVTDGQTDGRTDRQRTK